MVAPSSVGSLCPRWTAVELKEGVEVGLVVGWAPSVGIEIMVICEITSPIRLYFYH